MKNINKAISLKIGEEFPFGHFHPTIIRVQDGQSVIHLILNKIPFLKKDYPFMRSLVREMIFDRWSIFFEVRHFCKPKK